MSSVVSPDGTHLAAAVTDGGMALAIVDLAGWKVQQLVGNNAAANLRISGNDVGQEGPTYSPDGSQLWLSQADGYRRFTVNPDGSLANPTFVAIPADGPKRALVAQAVFSADGSTVYSAVNGQNRVVAIDATTGTIKQSRPVGNAPRDWSRSAPACTSATRAAAAPPGVVPAAQQPVATQWETWKAQQRLTGPTAKADSANPAQMNHFTWYQSHDWKQPYPGEDHIVSPANVPGAFIPPAETD